MNLAAILNSIIPFLDVLAHQTASTIDDKFVAFLRAVSRSPELIEWLHGIVESDVPPNAMRSVAIPDDVLAQTSTLDIGIDQVIAWLPLVVQLIRRLRAL